MPKIAIIGAGSLIFSRRMMIDCLSYPSMREAEFALVDIDEQRLELAGRIAERIIKEGGYDQATFTLTTDRTEALEGCDFVVISILSGGWEAIWQDIDIPLKYGVEQAIGDTTGPGGVFRMLRTAPHIIAIAQDIMELCPKAIVMNYTNPMSMLTMAACEAEPGINWVGLCHSVQGTASEWSSHLNIPPEEVNYFCAGINHLLWFLSFEHQGVDLLPAIREKALEPAVWKADPARCEYVKHFGYPVTESSGHQSEYSYWFRKRPKELLPRYCDGGWNATGFLKTIYNASCGAGEMEKIISNPEPMDLKRSSEYGSRIMNAVLTGEPTVINGNVPNSGLITNLPSDCIVEVPILVDKNGLQPTVIGDLPPHLAALDQANVNVHRMAVNGLLYADPEMIFQAIAFDPLTSAVCSLDEIREMVAEMFEAEAPHMPEFQESLERKPQLWKTVGEDIVVE